ncbi:hypothetical protein MPNT_80056 [Candidatus Methylacidithermus pantelleriae]|uniref:Uncharacterized protein n=1 Tax=Candidatus Methylacidithermus pantelleriae TaxID=2744239 RepID=A0A8J2FTW5_9BACT|nr:hypothetical protein MPNT_80056 [Candidatus Methylacidithermus pantelleriae]
MKKALFALTRHQRQAGWGTIVGRDDFSPASALVAKAKRKLFSNKESGAKLRRESHWKKGDGVAGGK